MPNTPTSAQLQEPDADLSFYLRIEGIGEVTGTPETSRTLYAREDVIYFRGEYDPMSDLTGLAPLAWAMRAALGDQAAESFMADFFANSAVPALLLSTDQQLPDPEVKRVVAFWEKYFKGAGKQHRTGIVGGGLKPFPLGVKPSDLALPDVRAAVHQTISTALGVPELLISPTGAADLTPVKIAQMLFYQNTILPRWSMIAGALTADPAETSVTVTDGTLVKAGEVISINSEKMYVVSISGNDLTVIRAYDGSTLAAHSDAQDVYAPRTATVTRGENGTTAAAHDTATAILKYAPPADVEGLCRAMATAYFFAEQGGWTGMVGASAAANVETKHAALIKRKMATLKRYQRRVLGAV